MSFNMIRNLTALGLISAMAAGCASGPSNSSSNHSHANAPHSEPMAQTQPAPPQTDSHQHQPASALIAPSLRHAWRVTQLGDKKVPTSSRSRAPSFSFDDNEARVGGDSSCNRFSASYTLQGNRIQFGPPMATKKACPGSVEREFFRNLEAVRSYEQHGNHLHLRDAAGHSVITLAH